MNNEFTAHDLVTYQPCERDSRQQTVALWVSAAFGSEQAKSLPQRGLRFLEESIELGQALGCNLEQVHKLVDYVFSRPVGNIEQEMGGVGVTLLALGSALGTSTDAAERAEVDRVLSKPLSHFEKRNKEKNDAGFLAT